MFTSAVIKLKKYIKYAKPRKTIIIFLFIFSGCSTSDKSSELIFLENVMIREGGLYVLMGTKPMCTFPIEDSGFPETEEEIEKAYSLYQSDINSQNKRSSHISYHDFAAECRNSTQHHYKKLWKEIQGNLGKLVGPRYLFVTRKNPFGERRKGGLFINIPNTLFILKKNKKELSEIYGAPFDPEKELLEISDENSLFWTCLFRSHFAQGILFGYGEQASFEFDWQHKNGLSLEGIKNQMILEGPLMEKKVQVKDLQLPNMKAFSLSDKRLREYKKERRLILKEMKGKDFEETVKEWLADGLQVN